jgi:hypothetical protein
VSLTPPERGLTTREQLWRLDQYAHDAERNGDEELTALFRKMQDHSRKGAEECKRLLGRRLQDD